MTANSVNTEGAHDDGKTPCLTVLTARGSARIVSETGTQAWRLKPSHARKLEYCVCVQNRNNGNGHWGGADHDHHAAFMVGRIADVVPSPEGRPDRYLVVFAEYALINYPNAWPGLRNPVTYAHLEDYGITDPDSLDWKPMPQPSAPVAALPPAEDEDPEDDAEPAPLRLTIPQAKAGLALGLGVPESAIEINVRF